MSSKCLLDCCSGSLRTMHAASQRRFHYGYFAKNEVYDSGTLHHGHVLKIFHEWGGRESKDCDGETFAAEWRLASQTCREDPVAKGVVLRQPTLPRDPWTSGGTPCPPDTCELVRLPHPPLLSLFSRRCPG